MPVTPGQGAAKSGTARTLLRRAATSLRVTKRGLGIMLRQAQIANRLRIDLSNIDLSEIQSSSHFYLEGLLRLEISERLVLGSGSLPKRGELLANSFRSDTCEGERDNTIAIRFYSFLLNGKTVVELSPPISLEFTKSTA
ncbi:hypothetical protein ACFL31_02125 [Candidatus Margulisiibacteriota bacterium]